MAMALGTAFGTGKQGDPDVMIDMNMTPLIDVMLVMIIMMIITIPIQNHSLNLNLPVERLYSTEKPVVDELAIDFDGTTYWNGVQVSRSVLDANLAQIGAMPQARQPELHIKPNRLADYRTVASVIASAQRSNVTELALVGNEEFLQN